MNNLLVRVNEIERSVIVLRLRNTWENPNNEMGILFYVLGREIFQDSLKKVFWIDQRSKDWEFTKTRVLTDHGQ